MADFTTNATSFGVAAGAYERGRPPYPADAVSWLLPSGARQVLDLGAGTGKLTRALVECGLDVVAVDPSAGMLAELSRALPQVRALQGSAEEIPLADASVDAVLVAQAWHWVDLARAVPEVARVLRPAGQLGLVWNLRDEQVNWVGKLGDLMHREVEVDMHSSDPTVGPPFGPIERLDVRWEQVLTRQDVLDLVASRSYIITMPAAERAEVFAGVAHLLDTHPALAGGAPITMPYRTECARTRLG